MLVIREMLPADLRAVAGCHLAAWQQGFAGILPAGLLAELTLEQFVETWESIFERSYRRNLVAELDGSVVGFLGFGPIEFHDAQPAAEIYAIYVHPEHWRSGAGRELLARGIDALKSQGYSRGFVWTMTENTRSRSFYEDCGLKASGKTRTAKREGMHFEDLKYTFDTAPKRKP